MKFEIKNRDAAGRICNFTTKHGTVKTPTLLPVINPNKMILTPKEMKKLFGVEMVITNSYIIKNDEKLRNKCLGDGVHKLLDFDGPIMTDSGTFQSYVYGDIDVDPLDIVKFQRDIGSDVGTILDIFGTPDQSKDEARRGVDETIDRAGESISIKGDMILACTIQGSIYPDLRRYCAKKLSLLSSDFFPIGGVVPLMENQRYSDLINCIISSKMGVDHSKPIHLFGAGHPLIFPLAVALGCDFFDSSAYIKYANDDRLIFPDCTIKLNELDELPCSCPVCSKYSADELKKADRSTRVLEIVKHNLYVSFSELKKIRTAIIRGNLWELVERRSYSNPFLYEALKVLRKRKNKDWLEKFEKISKNSALFYTGDHTIHRPLIFRLHDRLINRYRFSSDDYVILPDSEKPYSKHYMDEIVGVYSGDKDVHIIVDSKIGPVPIELDEMYPFSQSIFPDEVDLNSKNYIKRFFRSFTKDKKNYKFLDFNDRNNLIDDIGRQEIEKLLDIRKISSIADIQFGFNASEILFNGSIDIVKSKKTKKIRNIYCDDKHVLSMRAADGMFTLKLEGARLLHKFLDYPNLRVVISNEAVPFIRDGKSIFAKFVLDCDDNLRPFDECIIVDEDDVFLGNGRCLLNRVEMLSFNYGMAVKLREHI